ncbi:unnamed protein product [Rotaria sordida]|uniref:Uncharacterized protein n=1 Tax=Rotaria sordida TaxID=392033 RepID=A0A819PXC9_9BILA|nr:unnamed protein product [Rotaria sordida]CAF1315808.1 unnamed protein product [Rotaria sordida]CAF3972791.1 unnamed protein product [Rotaria sordida]CAF4015029.1 unnamed protein product [Rotaria sordida]
MIEFCLKSFLSTNSWLHAGVGIERAIIVQFGVQFNKKRNPLEQRTWYVVNYPSSFLKIYDTTTTMFHFLIPFLINIISAVIIIKTARMKSLVMHTTNYY